MMHLHVSPYDPVDTFIVIFTYTFILYHNLLLGKFNEKLAAIQVSYNILYYAILYNVILSYRIVFIPTSTV